MALFYNVKGSSVVGGKKTTELVAPSTDYNVKSILLVNVHDAADATVTLFIQDDPASGATSTYELMHGVAIPSGVSLILDNMSMFRFSNQFGLYISVGNNDLIDVIVNT
jgi:hypothetical protein